MRRLALLLVVACGQKHVGQPPGDPLAKQYPLSQLSERALCDQLLARPAADYAVTVDREARVRRKVIVSDLHLGPGNAPGYEGIEDFYSDDAWDAFLVTQHDKGPTDFILAGDIIDFWQIATGMGALPKRDEKLQPTGTMLAADQQTSLQATQLAIAAHPSVFRDLGAILNRGDHRAIILAGNHDADLLWPKVQLAIAHAIGANDPRRVVFVEGGAYEHAGVRVEHGHAYDAANRFHANHAPFGRDRDGACRLQSSWGEVFVDQFYTETERQVPFIDNLYPESAAILWAMRDNTDPKRDLGAAIRFVELIRLAETKSFNKEAAKATLQTIFGTPGKDDHGPGSTREVIDHLTDRLVEGDANARSVTVALLRLVKDPELSTLWNGLIRAAAALPDFRAALSALGDIDPAAMGHLRDELFGDSMETAAKRLATERNLTAIVFGHTHEVGGSLHPLKLADRTAYYANTGSWISVASVKELKARGITWDSLSIADRKTFPSKTTAVIIEPGGIPTVYNR